MMKRWKGHCPDGPHWQVCVSQVTLSPQSSSNGAVVRRSSRLMLSPLPVMMRLNTCGLPGQSGCRASSKPRENHDLHQVLRR